METLLNQTADGTANRWQRLYTLAHAAQCAHCSQFLDALQRSIGLLRRSKKNEPSPEVLARLANGARREARPPSEAVPKDIGP